MDDKEKKYLIQATLKDFQREMLRLLTVIDGVCRSNNIEYWLDAGTLLGAIRHKGFIPWDDDIDIGVPAGDYHRLIAALDVESKNYDDIFLYCEHNDIPRSAPEKLASTKMAMKRGGKIFSCFVDIFPARIIDKADRENDQKISKIVEHFTFGSALDGSKIDKKYIKNNLKSAIKAKQAFTKYFHFDYLPSCDHRNSESIVATIATTSSDAVCGTDAYFSYTDIFPLKIITFEGLSSFAPHETEKYLSTVYGDYTKLPPESSQVAKHADELYFCSSNRFALEETKNSLIKSSQSFYRAPLKRLVKNLIKNIGIYEKIKNWDRERRKHKYAKRKSD
jgi:lipopolysaccharide cholinephosphotransferase